MLPYISIHLEQQKRGWEGSELALRWQELLCRDSKIQREEEADNSLLKPES